MKVLSLINVSNVILYNPLSKNTPKNRSRLDLLSDIANETNTDIDKLMWYLSRYIANIISHSIKESIRKQTINGRSMKSSYKPLNKKYRKSKPHGTKGKFWVNSGFLYSNIRVYSARGNWYVGVPERVKYQGRNISVKKVILYMEKGTSKQPARPLITPIVKNIEKRIDQVFKNFIKEITT